jgi:aspartyl-tRNA(Asn)/glutamyl-tRNA(Gln) amidotransferase subunit A
VGLKPTYGAVSRSGLIAAASSLDQIGSLTKTTEDAHILFKAIRGQDPLDSTTLPDLGKSDIPKKMRIGIPRALLAGLEADVLARFDAALAKSGAEIVDIAIPLSDIAIAAYYIINFAEVSTNLARFDGIRYGLAKRGETLLDDYVQSRTEGFGAETRRRILLGTFALSAGYIDAYYKKAGAARVALRAAYEEIFESVDLIATPTMPTPAFKIGEKSDPLEMYLEDIFTVTANLTGTPAISVPMGFVERSGKKLPVGIHFTAPHQSEETLFFLEI